jgi:hypothetical protein
MAQQFDERDAEEILKRAAAMDGNAQIDRAIMERTAAELGISPENLARAEADYLKERERTRHLDEFLTYRKKAMSAQFGLYVVINCFLIGIWAFGARGGYFWPMWPIMGWGIGLAVQFLQLRNQTSDDFHREFAEWKARRGLA